MTDPAKDVGHKLDREQKQAQQDERRAQNPRAAQKDYAPHHTPHERPVDPFLKGSQS